MTEIGFVGLGRIGAPMAKRLVDSGYTVVGFDRSPSACAAAAQEGVMIAATLKEVADQCATVFLSLPSPAVVLDVALGSDGLHEGSAINLCIDLSTSGPQAAQQLSEGFAHHAVATLEAPVSGGIQGARQGKLSLMVAGPESDWVRAEPLLHVLGRPFYMGDRAGAGQMMKLVNNLLGACAIAITSEGMALGMKAGLDPARMIDVLNVSSGRNSATEDKWPRSVLPRTFDFGFTAGLSLKDTRLCCESAEALGVPLSVGSRVLSLLERTVAAYGADADFTSMARILEAEVGLELPVLNRP
jgi:3-hydroxyisobutyrate dehydrogenase-like beta-hydroxyacid dehydrogenase